MTQNSQKWTKPHPTDLHWNHKNSLLFLKERIWKQNGTNTLERIMMKSNAMERKKQFWNGVPMPKYWDEMRCSEKRSAGEESSILGEHTSAVLGVRQYNTRDTEKIQESPHDVLLSLLPSEWGCVTSSTVKYWCYSFPLHPTNSLFQIWHDSQYKIRFFLN